MSGTLVAAIIIAMAGTPRFGVLADQQHVITTEQRPAVNVTAPPPAPPIEFVPIAEIEPAPSPVAEPEKAKPKPAKKKTAKKKRVKKHVEPKSTNCEKGKP